MQRLWSYARTKRVISLVTLNPYLSPQRRERVLFFAEKDLFWGTCRAFSPFTWLFVATHCGHTNWTSRRLSGLLGSFDCPFNHFLLVSFVKKCHRRIVTEIGYRFYFSYTVGPGNINLDVMLTVSPALLPLNDLQQAIVDFRVVKVALVCVKGKYILACLPAWLFRLLVVML